MNALRNIVKPSLAILMGALLAGGCATMGSTEVALSGSQEVPPVTTA